MATIQQEIGGFVYRVSPQQEWNAAKATGRLIGSEFDASSGFIHLSTADQVQRVLEMFYAGRTDLVLLKIDASELGEGVKYEEVSEVGVFPHFYGTVAEKQNERNNGSDTGRTAAKINPLPLSAVVNALNIIFENGKFTYVL
eukprot:TRINITY_DN3864_c0_g1_i2.p1 TRINITY_DN3864_c0_g1~~TRINITY_DN3864_c0_g1_i2.p1  ORF type:complete len:142 (-),score=39.40 TRINITY_DN3864_c0_g1_i2:58-483(-)